MPIINIKDIPELKMVKLVDLSDDSINKIAEAVAQKIADPIKHGYWKEITDPIFASTYKCSVCGNDAILDYDFVLTKYCPNCGSKMDEVE